MASEIKVGSVVVHYETRGPQNKGREILRTTIVRETATQWTAADGSRWRKGDRAEVPQYKPGPRYIMTAEDFDAQVSK